MNIQYYIKRPHLIIPQMKYKFFLTRNPEVPRISPSAIEFLNSWLTSEHKILEWGSGRSTTWFAKRVKEIVSVESHYGWFNKVSEKILGLGFDNVDYRLIELEGDEFDQKEAIVTNRHIPYVDEVLTFGEEYFDAVLIDGAYRHVCVQRAVSKIRPGGIMIIDNSNWLKNLDDWGVPAEWKLIHSSSIKVAATSVWQKISLAQ